MMKGKGLKRLILIVALLALIVPAVSVAYTVNSMAINPSSGALTPGTTVDISFTVQEPSGQTTTNDLVMYTALKSPQWSYIINVNGNPTSPAISGSPTVDVSGFLLTYKSSDDVTVGVTLSGTVPTVTQTSNQTLIQISQAQSLPSTQYTDALNDLTTATSTIANGETLLDKAWAESEIATAQG